MTHWRPNFKKRQKIWQDPPSD